MKSYYRCSRVLRSSEYSHKSVEIQRTFTLVPKYSLQIYVLNNQISPNLYISTQLRQY
jgi:hypothetical protein